MSSKSKMNRYTDDYLIKIEQTSELISSTDYILAGIGSGMTASGGLCYTDPALADKWYPEYFATGKRSIIEIMGGFWVTTITEDNAAAYWGFWARHIYHIRYEASVLQPYSDLYQILREKKFFIASTNVDGQLEKAGFDKRDIFAPQGDYALFQCSQPCSQEVYDNKTAIYAMCENMVSPFKIRASDIPRCPRCGGLLIPNLRCDLNFVEKPHIQNAARYERFLTEAYGSKLVIIELGVGYNTPTIIRLPFEAITLNYPNATLIRINRDDTSVLTNIAHKAICIQADVKAVLQEIRNLR